MKTQLHNTLRFVYTYKIVHVYLLILGFYAFIISLFSGEALTWVKIFIIFSDPIMLGLFFVGGIVLIEKNEGVLKSIAISPCTIDIYLISKTIVLSLLAVVIAVILSLVNTNHFTFAMITGVILGNILFTLVGLWLVSKVNTINQYIIYATPLTMLITLPFIAGLVFGIRILTLNPVHIIYELIARAQIESSYPLAVQILMLLVWITLFYIIVRRRYIRLFKEGQL